MLFNSESFILFIVIFLLIYFVTDNRYKVFICLLGSYIFYGFWDYRFLLLIITSTLVDFLAGKQIELQPIRKKILLITSLLINLGILGYFKYCNFFVDTFYNAFGWSKGDTLNIILPIGISFYTFQSISYTIDVYRGRIQAEKNLWHFATYIAFFPQLVAGPIVRSADFLPQLKANFKWNENRFFVGMQQVAWGFFKKVVIADSLAPYIDQCFTHTGEIPASQLLIGAVFYSFQIYADFSGYSDIAIGLARMMGFSLPENFHFPYFSTSIQDFWRRWHISLSTWLRDYLYISLGGNKDTKPASWIVLALISLVMVLTHENPLIIGLLLIISWVIVLASFRNSRWSFLINLLVTMILGGLWHGAAWSYVIWGWLHGLLLILHRLNKVTFNTSYIKFLHIIIVFCMVTVLWILFRAENVTHALLYLESMMDSEVFNVQSITNKLIALKGICIISFLLFHDYINYKSSFFKTLADRPIYFMGYIWVLCIGMLFLGTYNQDTFIYFQF